jgi:Zn-dependent M28 family amino/carboxypeptidase
MPIRNVCGALAAALLVCSCAAPPPAKTSIQAPAAAKTPPLANEGHLRDLTQLTFGGENAEAYWSWDGRSLSLQARVGDAQCDRIYRLPVADAAAGLLPVSSGKGATTCAHFMPGDREILFASTHLGGDACPPKPDHSQGYVWALYPSYDIFKSELDGKNLKRLTETPGYDAEATVCGKDGSIVFTSVRDGDIDLYRMDADGKNVRRLTHTPGYDGGAFFDKTCERIVWRASRPRPGKELDDYRALLAQGLVRPSKLELYVANADGSEAMQITYLDAASFAPYFHPSGRKILFSSNVGDPRGREFDIYSINVDGSGLERVTTAPGFDGFPMFSPDGSLLAFSSNRATAPGARDTNVFLARWVEHAPGVAAVSAADRVMADVRYLADPAREGRGIGSAGIDAASAHIEQRLRELRVTPAFEAGQFRQRFEVVTALDSGPASAVTLDGKALAPDDFVPLGFSPPSSKLEGEVVSVAYGIVEKSLGIDDYAQKNVKGKIVLVRRFVPDDSRFASTDAKRRYGDLRYKAWLAKERGALALLVVDAPLPSSKPPKATVIEVPPTRFSDLAYRAKAKVPEAMGVSPAVPDEAPLPPLTAEGHGNAGLPALVLKRAAARRLFSKLDRGQRARAELNVELVPQKRAAFNLAGRIDAAPADGRVLPGTIVIGAHYDHLGLGGRYSLSPEKKEPHVGADDNASGVAVVLELARALMAERHELRRNVVVALFSGEESGLLGSSHFVKEIEAGKLQAIKPKEVLAMLNLDMVGRLRENRVQVLGADTAAEWKDLIGAACSAARVDCPEVRDGGFGPSDQMSFFVAGVPVLHFFTGSHTDYHKPTDTPDKINAAGAAQIGSIVANITRALSQREGTLGYQASALGPAPRGDLRNFNATLGTIPDYAGPGAGKSGVLLSGVRPGSPAEKAGLKRGDVLVRLGRHDIRSIEDFMFVLNGARPGDTTTAVILRDGKQTQVTVTFEARGERPR